MKRRDLEKHLKNNNCELLREGGRHSIWVNILNNKKTSIPRHKEIDNHLAKEICKQLEIPLPTKY